MWLCVPPKPGELMLQYVSCPWRQPLSLCLPLSVCFSLARSLWWQLTGLTQWSVWLGLTVRDNHSFLSSPPFQRIPSLSVICFPPTDQIDYIYADWNDRFLHVIVCLHACRSCFVSSLLSYLCDIAGFLACEQQADLSFGTGCIILCFSISCWISLASAPPPCCPFVPWDICIDADGWATLFIHFTWLVSNSQMTRYDFSRGINPESYIQYMHISICCFLQVCT